MVTTNDVYNRFGYSDLYDSNKPRKMNEIWNESVPLGNQYTVKQHVLNVTSAYETINSGKSFRCDYHTGETADFMAMCNEMHIVCDNQCESDKFHNEFYMEQHALQLNARPMPLDILLNKLLGWEMYLPRWFSTPPKNLIFSSLPTVKKKNTMNISD